MVPLLALMVAGAEPTVRRHHSPKPSLDTTITAQPAAEPTPPPEVAKGEGPLGTSGSGKARYDEVGRAAVVEAGKGALVLGSTLPAGSFVEVTALDNGKTILARVADGPAVPDRLAALSADAGFALGLDDGGPVRIRSVTPVPPDEAALRSGGMAAARADAPPVLLVALRHRLAEPTPAATPAPQPSPTATAVAKGGRHRTPTPRPTPTSTPTAKPQPEPHHAPTAQPTPPGPTAAGHFYVQVAAVSVQARAEALAHEIGGHVVANGKIYRVRLGPYPTAAAANAARDGAAKRGYRDARVGHDS